ncbi:MAG: acetyl-CoA carboxylase carboxyltransferase subunit alpha [Planctomycetes bacterium]|nr:acetyl-CoA carboxylase carboxyltransferase subunit alpha [Planctomycetota bacterium]
MSADDVFTKAEYTLPFEQPIARLARQIEELVTTARESGRDYSAEIRQLRVQLINLIKKTYADLSAWETVQVSRHPRRPLAGDYISSFVKDFVEIHGDRAFGDDRSIVCGFGRIGREKVVLVAQHKGRDTKERIACHFGCPMPEGYRKALRAMKLAEKFHLPIVTLIDTPGAFPGVESEERGVAEAIAVNLREMSRLRTPILCTIISEGGSGGALGIGVGDRMAMLEYAYYSVISPEGCAAILWKSGEQAPQAAEALQLTSRRLVDLDIIDTIIPEPLGGAHRNPAEAATNLERYITRSIRELRRADPASLLDHRYARWRRIGRFERLHAAAAPAAPAETVQKA